MILKNNIYLRPFDERSGNIGIKPLSLGELENKCEKLNISEVFHQRYISRYEYGVLVYNHFPLMALISFVIVKIIKYIFILTKNN